MKNLLSFLIVIFLNPLSALLANEKLPDQLIEYKYDLEMPDKLNLNISGKNYIKYLKQIKLTSQKDNLNSKVINSTLITCFPLFSKFTVTLLPIIDCI